MQSGGLGDQIFFQYVLGRSDFNAYVPKRKKPKELPVFLSTEEVKRLFDVMTNPKHKTLLMTAYGTGMRVSELVRLRIVDLDCSRQMLRVNQGKGQKDRFTILPLTLIDQLEVYRKAYQPQDYFFYSRAVFSSLYRLHVFPIRSRSSHLGAIVPLISLTK